MMLQRNDVSVMTPQLLLNMLTAVPSENGDELATKITDFSLIVFDECHHSDKSHAYNEIMIAYFDIKFDKNRPTDDEKLPQVDSSELIFDLFSFTKIKNVLRLLA